MNNLEIRKIETLERINRARKILDQELKYEVITDSDIFSLLKKDKDYMFSKTKGYKQHLLKQIVESPFVLCDQDRLNIDLKKILPIILSVRCQMELEELENMQELGMIDNEEFKEEKEMIKFAYYLSSEDGREILRTGHVKNVKSNVLYKNKK